MTPNWGSERAKWKTWGRWIATNSRLKPINLFKADLGALKSKNFLPNKSTTMKSAAHPVSINRSVSELTFREFIAAVEADSWFEWLCGIATWLLDMDWHWWTITTPVENTARKTAKIRANRLLLLATMRMEKLYHLSPFVWLLRQERLWIVIESTELRTANTHETPQQAEGKIERASISRGPPMQNWTNSFDHYQ